MNDVVTPSGRVLNARYTLHERLGAGGQGEVWRARDPQRDCDIALKVLHPAESRVGPAWAALQREHAISSRLEHAHILKVYPPEATEEALLLPMELAAGGDLRRMRGADYLAVVPVLLEVAQALQHAHERGVIHRDLKPGNVLFDARGGVKLADFGIAGTVLAAGADPAHGVSPFSASPQQLRGEPPTPADDVYGLGALAYELLSGYPPHYPHFDARRVLREPVPELVPAQQMPPQLGVLVMRMLHKEAQARPASMLEVIEALESALNDTLTFEFETAEPPRDATAPAERTGKHPALSMPPPRPNATLAAVPPSPGEVDGQALWEEMRLAPAPSLARLEPMRSSRPSGWLVLALVAALAGGAYFLVPRFTAWSPPQWLRIERAVPGGPLGVSAPPPAAPAVAPALAPAAAPAGNPAAAPARVADAGALRATRAAFERRLSALAARGADSWGGADFAAARSRAAESVGAADAGDAGLARARLREAQQLLDGVERAAPAALAAQLEAGNRALRAGQVAAAVQAFELAHRIDPQNAQARSALTQAQAGQGGDNYARAAGAGFAALGAGRLAEARAAFERARAIRPDGAEALDGLRRVSAAERAHAPAPAASAAAPARAPSTPASAAPPPAEPAAVTDLSSIRTHAAQLEALERWDEAEALYSAALREDPALTFAQAGKARAGTRARLDHALQALLDRPERLASADTRARAIELLDTAQATTPSGPVLRSQIARLQILLPDFGKPVQVSLVSDNSTQVAILSVGSFGTFERRDIELLPGTYTVIGSRVGYRDVRRQITISPGETQTVSVSCFERI